MNGFDSDCFDSKSGPSPKKKGEMVGITPPKMRGSLFWTNFLAGLLQIKFVCLTAFFVLQRAKRQSKPPKPALKVTEYHVRSSVVSRYAVTTVQSSVWNQLPIVKEAAFEVDLPSSAFISNFTISSDGKVYVAQVKERAAARKIYDAAKKQGKTAGLVATKEREIEKFRVAVSVPSGTRMSFLLTYEELLSRRLGRYELSLGLRPGQPVQNLTVDVRISERTGISFIKVLPLKTSRLISNNNPGDTDAPVSSHVEKSATCARVQFSPTLKQQSNVSSKGLNADFIIQYDVELTDLIGDVQVYDGYFVHYFAPRGLPVVPKDVIFVIDISGSMIGNKMKQTKQAMTTILGDLREGDHFNIITFSDKVQTWKKGRTVRATRTNVREAQEFVRRIMAEGWTNINAALLSAAQLINPSSSSGSSGRLVSSRVPLVIFLTDGEATIGVTSGDIILNNAKKALGSTSLFGLAFGDDADLLLLKRLALENGGVARMVYEDADAALQLKGFYDEVASPLLSDIQLSYLDDQAFDVTRSLFPNYFQGSELVVAGRVKPGVHDLKVSMSATDLKEEVKLENDVDVSQEKGNESRGSVDCLEDWERISSIVHRLWAYFTIKELSVAKLNTTDPAAQKLLTEKATNLSLKYNFVTPFTSLVVVKPDAEEPTTTPPMTKPTTTVTTTTTNKPAAFIKKLSLQSKNSQSTQKVKNTLPPISKVSPPKKTASSNPIKAAMAAISGKIPSTSQNKSKNASSPLTVKMPKSLPPQLPAPAKLSTSPPGSTKTIPRHQVTSTTSAPTTPLRTSTPHSSPLRTAHPSVNKPETSAVGENATKTAPDHHGHPETSTAATKLVPALSLPDVEDDSETDAQLSVSTLVPVAFLRMPGVTKEPQPQVAELVDDVTLMHFQENDYDFNFDYDYNLNYDGWDDPASGFSFEPQPRPNSNVFVTSVDGDPHFLLQLPRQNQSLCFTVDGKANDVLRLLEDPENGIVVDGRLLGAPSKHGVESRSRTYFDQLIVSSLGSSGEITITVSLDAVAVEGEGRDTLPVNQQASITRQGVTVTVDNHHGCWMELARGVRFLVLFHRYKHPSYLQMAHLGFYIANGGGLSASTQGLMGQFQHADISITEMQTRPDHPPNTDRTAVRGVLRWGSEQMPVTLQDKMLKDSLQKSHPGKCWVVPKAQVERLLGRPYDSYVVNRV
ncbi:inter-alpha-trypsin inhibitor heavy chain H6 isoform X2 [Oryzias melastigma]|uniref:inter-alpha-trypsin inhibitor heavy chain H6 isoform X2 n=1 Tax=Oryzias melastigma TaxID=30732 RepID=UPI00168D9155|nr:inter-alpha-trypsin inhibitor heavy chain H6 isoform X2 [Oryzias melastigma]